MASWASNVPSNISQLFNRGGLFELDQVIFFTVIVFIFVGSIDLIEAMPKIVDKVFSFAKSRPLIIISSLFATTFTNAITSNQNATSFIIGDAFRKRYEQYKIPRKVLSRSIEDYGTMVESIIPWSATTLFMSSTLNVPFSQYWHWQLLSLVNLIVPLVLAVTGKGCFYHEVEKT
jgi:NhaC family Na+:H+ antiporter